MSSLGDTRDEVITELRRRLAEAEDTLSAIRHGEVDALVVQGCENEEIFTIEGDEGYRDFMEAMDLGAVALDAIGTVVYANRRIGDVLGVSPEALRGRRLFEHLDAEAAARFAPLLDSTEGAKLSANVVFKRDGVEQHFLVASTPLRIGTISGYAVTFTDVTERVRAEAAEQSERAARAVIASANEAVLVCDSNGLITHANAAAGALCEEDPVGKPFADTVPLVFPGATGLVQGDDIVALALEGSSLQGIEAVAPRAPKVKDYLVSAAPLRVVGDQISGCVITMVDLSQRKAFEKQQLLLMAELDHRVKNTLALVQSISSRTLSSEDTLDGFHVAFSGRLQALAATHNLLAERSWTNLSLRDVVTAELAPYVEKGASRVALEGLEVHVAPRAAIAVGLIVHELTTNAVKHGALSSGRGQVTISSIAPSEKGPFVLEWRESGGPAVSEPTRRGFGGTVIARSLQYSPEGNAQLVFEPSGVVCTISIPGDDVIRAETRG